MLLVRFFASILPFPIKQLGTLNYSCVQCAHITLYKDIVPEVGYGKETKKFPSVNCFRNSKIPFVADIGTQIQLACGDVLLCASHRRDAAGCAGTGSELGHRIAFTTGEPRSGDQQPSSFNTSVSPSSEATPLPSLKLLSRQNWMIFFYL